jgi:hypothetical protein
MDGVSIPQWRGKVEAIQCVLDNPTQLLSVQPAYERMVGSWPHRFRRNGDYVSSLHVMPEGGKPDDESDWSVVYFRTLDNPNTGIGARADLCLFDEPPPMKPLREMRKAGHAGRRGIIVIAETPEVRKQWAPLREDYGDTPRRTTRRVDEARAECRWSMDEVADWVLSPEEKRRLWSRYRGDVLFGEDGGARWHGDYMNTEGKCPFDVDTLLQMIADCHNPEIVEWRVSREPKDQDGAKTVGKVSVEVFAAPQSGRRYYIAIDPASGVDDGSHNPAALHVVEMGTADLVARWNGYLPPYSVGVLATGLARQYGNSPIDIEMKDHWGVNVVRGITASNYNNLCYEQRELRPGEFGREAGFDMNEQRRALIIGAIQEWIEAWRTGIKYGKCPSKRVLESIIDTELDNRGKIVAIQGIDHGEDFVLRGQCLSRCVSRSGRQQPQLLRSPRTPDQTIADMIRGAADDPDDREPPFSGGGLRVRKF